MAGHKYRRANQNAQVEAARNEATAAGKVRADAIKAEVEKAKAQEYELRKLREQIERKTMEGFRSQPGGKPTQEAARAAVLQATAETVTKIQTMNARLQQLQADMGAAENRAREAGSAAAAATRDLLHAHNVETKPGTGRVHALCADHGDQLITAGGVVATAAGAIYPPAGIIAGVAVAATAVAIKQEQAAAARRDEKAEQNKVVIQMALNGQKITRQEAQAILEGQGWTAAEAAQQVGTPAPGHASPAGATPAAQAPAPAPAPLATPREGVFTALLRAFGLVG